MKAIFLIALLPGILLAKNFDLSTSIAARDFYLQNYEVIFGDSNHARKEEFINSVKKQKKSTRKKIKRFISQTEDFLPEKILMPLIHWRYIKKDKTNVAIVLEFAIMWKFLSLRDYINDPRSKNPLKALHELKELSHDPDLNTNQLKKSLFNDFKEKAIIMAAFKDEEIFIRALRETEVLTIDLKDSLPDYQGYTLDPYGFIPGNKVELISDNRTDLERLKWVNDRSIIRGGSLDFSKPYMRINTHPVFNEDPIFIKLKKMVRKANDTVFIDIFLFGGTMGGTYAKFLLDETLKKKEGFKLLILHDYATNYNMKDEMMPVFEYIKERIDNEPILKERAFLLQANIQRHPPGIPFNLTGLIPKTDEVFSVIEKKNTYYESKIDHSKIIIIDANGASPEAYFGSKNWTDHSGSYYYDNMLWVQGPAAALIQDSYIEDIEAALTEDKKEQKWFFYKEQGFDNKAYLSRKKEIISHFKLQKTIYPMTGNSTLRIAEANVDGRIRNFRNTYIDLIRKTKKSILMEQLFFYDPYIVDALILKKKQNPEIEIKLLLDNNENFGFNGFPNTIFIQELKDVGIEVRSRVLHGDTATFVDGTTQVYHQENHRKITSFDGEVLMVGSSNINPDTLQGSFREIGAVVYDYKEAEKFERSLRNDWSNKELVREMNIKEFQLKLGENYLSTLWSKLINNIAGTLFRSKDKIEKRY